MPYKKVLITKTEDAKELPLPAYMTQNAAGMDLYANVAGAVVIPKGGTALIPTGIKIALPEGYEAQIRPRSGLALKYGVTLLNSPGTIDADYRGEIKVIMVNHGKGDFIVQRGDRVAQMVVNRIETVELVQVEALDDTQRGDGGFGHTGIDA